MLMSHVCGKGFRIQWEKIRQSLLRADPLGVHQRCRESIRCHVYRVSGPLALWHIDGNHKLIRCSPYFSIIFTNDKNVITLYFAKRNETICFAKYHFTKCNKLLG